ncbi:MAG: methionyl-tRNA formyltransferase [Betaproteobacteria bacterium]|nr:MAG: methionyl-tRNA formyltransferase [Betaproteobacteria bacterium]TMH90109.1 MAG: methionyl-tRNA formyltransferase [Betaproteobacteria bacterium]
MNVLFAGTPEFAARCLEALLKSRHRVIGVITQPDRPAGRGFALAPSPVKKLASARGIQMTQPESLRDAQAQAKLKHFRADVIVVAAYGLILPRPVLELPRDGAINIHASLLPRWRGATPIERAILAGDRHTGVSIMQMDDGLDTGPVLMQEEIPILEDDTMGTLRDRLAELGAKLIVQALDALQAGVIKATPQSAEGVTYAAKLEKREARVDWRKGALTVNRQVRALNPSPGADARVRRVELKIWRCATATGRGNAGEILSIGPDGLCVACGEGALVITELQRSGGKRLRAADFLRGFPLTAGERFDAQ